MDTLQSFERLSPAKQKLLLARLRKKEEADAIPPSPRRGTGEPFPLSFPQQRLWFLARLDPGNPSYNINDALRIEGPLQVPALAAALAALVARHEALRTRFFEVDSTPWQAPLAPGPVPLPLADLSALPPPAAEAETGRVAEAFVLEPFDLARGPHLRTLLVRRAPGEHRLFSSVHHIVSDGWSMILYRRELAHLYGAAAAGCAAALPPLPLQFADYADWQSRRLGGDALARLLAKFAERIAGAPTVLEVPGDHLRPPVATHRGARVVAEPPALARTLDALARTPGDTRFMALLAGFAALLSRLTGREDLLVGSPFANRTRVETEGVFGFFVNTLVLRLPLAELPEEAGFAALVALARRAVLAAWATEDLPFERAVAEVNPERDTSRSPLFQVVCSLQPPARREETGAVAGLTLTPLDAPARVSHVDLGIEGIDLGSRFFLEWRYSTDLYEETTVTRFSALLEALLAGAAAEPARPFRTLPWMSTAQVEQLIRAGRGEEIAAVEGCLHDPFFRRAAAAPGAAAVIAAGGRRVTYGELAGQAGRLAGHLRARGLAPEARVGLFLPRSPELVAAILAVLAAGGAYVPLDPGYPAERLAYMAADAGVAVVVTVSELAEQLPAPASGEVLLLDRLGAPAAAGPPSPPLPAQLAYVLYTSGSTGRPKGVALEHRSAAARIAWAQRSFSPAERAGVLGQASISFDLWVFEMFLPLSSGGTLMLADNLLDLPRLPDASRVTMVNLVPSLAAELLRHGPLPPSVCAVNLGGEAPSRALVERIYEQGGPALRVWNIYGPTEDTTLSAAALQAPGDPAAPRLGGALAGSELHLLDRRLEPVPAGVPGEIFLGGVGLARGYLGRPDLTAERFIPHPRPTRPGERLYRTGDLARRAGPGKSTGEVEFLGRIDAQVKLRGFRIELSEIEAVLAAHPNVAGAAAVVVGPVLLAFFVPEGEAPAEADLLTFLQEKLPPSMLPAGFRALPELPLTPNGKVDRRALERLAGEEGDGAYVAPREGIEALLAALWAALLGVSRVGARDDFFALGGHSLLAVRLTARIFEEVGVELPIAALFEKRRLCDLAAEVGRRIEQRESERRIDGLIEEIGDLSEEELLALLAAQADGASAEGRDG